MKKLILIFLLVLGGCNFAEDVKVVETSIEAEDLSMRAKRSAITDKPWQEVVINAERFEDIAPFFQEIAGYETLFTSETDMLLGAPGAEGGHVRLKQIGAAEPARPANSRAWDTGCYFSLMLRAKNLPSIIEDAKALGWMPLTELAYLEFGPSKLNVIVLTHKSGVRVQLYERLTTPLPEGFTPFERVSRPFNIMQMVQDRDVSYDFFQQKLGFDTFYFGKPFLSKKEEVMPIGLPPELTTTIPYRAGIMVPKAGLEYGRFEVIDIQGMEDGVNYADRCTAKHTGIITVRFEVDDLEAVRKNLRARKVDIFGGSAKSLSVKTPDGANIEFYQK